MDIYKWGRVWVMGLFCFSALISKAEVIDEITFRSEDFWAGFAVEPLEPSSLDNLHLALGVYKQAELFTTHGLIDVGAYKKADVLGKRFLLDSTYAGFKEASDNLISGDNVSVMLFLYWPEEKWTPLINVNFQTYSTDRPDFIDPLLTKGQPITGISFEIDALNIIYPGIIPPPPPDMNVQPIDPNRWISFNGTLNIKILKGAPVPESSTYSLAAIGLFALLVVRRKLQGSRAA